MLKIVGVVSIAAASLAGGTGQAQGLKDSASPAGLTVANPSSAGAAYAMRAPMAAGPDAGDATAPALPSDGCDGSGRRMQVDIRASIDGGPRCARPSAPGN